MKSNASYEGETTVAVKPMPSAAVTGPSLSVRTISRFVVIEELGRGGMGRVLRAYDPKLQREVALKELWRDSLDDSMTRRLVTEARAMAKLTHPNVVTVYDVEELVSGEVVLVMEYVPGVTLRSWLDEARHKHDAIVAGFVQAGRGLQAAHRVGLLHRDFKPSNVLVGADGTMKVTDFGLAKSVGCRDPKASTTMADGDAAVTQAGTVMGTPRFMAPEQHADQPLTEAADQYSFCVALWQALCGASPFSGRDLLEQKRNGPPPWSGPSVPRAVIDALRRGLSSSPEQRWPDMGALLDALTWDPSRRRKRWLVAAGGVVTVAMVTLVAERSIAARTQQCSGAREQLSGVWDEARRQEVQDAMLGIDRPHAQSVWDRSSTHLDDYAQSWARMHRETCEATAIRREQSSDAMDLRMACLHRARVQLRAVTAVLAHADAEVVNRAHEVIDDLNDLATCADLEALRSGVEPPRPEDEDKVEASRAFLARARSLTRAGRYPQAQAAIDEAEAALDGSDYEPVRIELALQRGRILDRLGKYQAARDSFDTSLALALRRYDVENMRVAAKELLFITGDRMLQMDEALQRYSVLAVQLSIGEPRAYADALNSVAAVLYRQGKYEQAETRHREALALYEGLGIEDHDLAHLHNNLGSSLEAQGKYDDAESQYRRSLEVLQKTFGIDHPEAAGARENLGFLFGTAGRYLEAEAEHRKVLSLRLRTLGPAHPDIGQSHNAIAIVLHRQGRYEESEEEFRRALELWENALGSDHPTVADARNNLALVLSGRGAFDEAESQLRLALESGQRTLGPEHPDVATRHGNLGIVLHEAGKHEAAEAEHRRSIELKLLTMPEEHPGIAIDRHNLGLVFEAQARYEEAEAEHRAALVAFEAAHGSDHPHVAAVRRHLAGVVLELGRVDEALSLAELAWQRERGDDNAPVVRSSSALMLARALWATSERTARRRARDIAEQTLQALAEDPEEASKAALQQWLDRHTS